MRHKTEKMAIACLGLYVSAMMTAASFIDSAIPVESIYQSSEPDVDYLKFRHLMKAIRSYVAQLPRLESDKNQKKLYEQAAGEIIKAIEKAQDYQRNGMQRDVLKYVRGALMRAQQNLFSLPLNAFWIDAFWHQVQCVLDWVSEVEPKMIREQIALLKTDIKRFEQEKAKVDLLARQEWEEDQKNSSNDEESDDSEEENGEEFYYRAQKRHLDSMIKDRKSKMRKLEALAPQVGLQGKLRKLDSVIEALVKDPSAINELTVLEQRRDGLLVRRRRASLAQEISELQSMRESLSQDPSAGHERADIEWRLSKKQRRYATLV